MIKAAEIEPRLLDLEADTKTISLLKPASTNKAVKVYYIPRPCDIHPLQFENLYLNFIVQESWELKPRKIFMLSMVIGGLLMIHECIFIELKKIPTCPNEESKPNCWIFKQTLILQRRHLCQCSRSVLALKAQQTTIFWGHLS